MKRMQLFEFEDFPWFPGFLRECMVDYLVTLHRVFRTRELILPILRRALDASGQNAIVDLCSGGGGPIPGLVQDLKKERPVTATLTDLYPSHEAAQRIGRLNDPDIRYSMEPVDAGQVPEKLQGLRTMTLSFHHMPLPVAKKILRDAFDHKQALMVFEISDNSAPKILWWLAFPAGIFLVLFVTAFMRPMRLRQFILTYLIPVLPLLIAWDGAASNARTYCKKDLEELTGELKSKDYRWEINKTRIGIPPFRMLYLLGLPS